MSFVMREFAVCACCQDTMWYTVVACRPDRRLYAADEIPLYSLRTVSQYCECEPPIQFCDRYFFSS